MGAKGASRGSTAGGAQQGEQSKQGTQARGAARDGEQQSTGKSKVRGAAKQGGREKEREGPEDEERGPELRGAQHKTKETKRKNKHAIDRYRAILSERDRSARRSSLLGRVEQIG